jgi:predicted kinase
MKELFLLRGLPGSGKSTLANSIGGTWVEADTYFINPKGEYEFDASKLKQAHKWCQDVAEEAMNFQSKRIVVSNTFTQAWEMEYYYDLAKEHGYRVYSLVVENRHEGINSHSAPQELLDKMKNRFEIKL